MRLVKRFKIDKPEYDWQTELGVYARNRDSRLFENTSAVQGMTVVLFEDADENDVANALADDLHNNVIWDSEDYTLYNKYHELVGYCYREN